MRRTTDLGAGMLAVAGLVLLAACSGTSEGASVRSSDGAGASSQDDVTVQRQKAENMIADCMKQKGFTYVPDKSPVSEGRDAQYVDRRSLLQPDNVVRPLREKYGFGVAAKEVYPNDPNVVTATGDGADNPNNAIREGLDAAGRHAYDKALGLEGKNGDAAGCASRAYAKYVGTTDLNAQQAEDRKTWDTFSSDPAVVQAAKKYANCLRGKGYDIHSSKPGDVETYMLNLVRPTALAGIGAEDDTAASGSSNDALKAEIKKAVDDLDCRGSYAEIVRTKYPQVVGIDANGIG